MAGPHAESGASRGRSSTYPAAAAAGDSSALLISALAGAVIGAAGLAWWLLSEAEKRRLRGRQQRALRLSRLQDSGGGLDEPTALPGSERNDRELHDKVHQLNEAIDAVRRQLEAMATGR
ncbi:hypothetical protein [Cyanobium sp. NIES-981]|uniref:hypothetical protein n=1 Tax=Cyanobium sp. NIES-981 TaxID=1851505 RepID=UPI0007DDA7F3|nr:hypothetical protein [Cyanobium sp. NIES-981]SBO42315.1 conserved protein of unknown function [Cyanobium sp. NIES-981]